jgi:cell wall-associated NlpC family hydrolase
MHRLLPALARIACRAGMVLTLSCTAAVGLAAPDQTSVDPVSRLLIERGLMPAAAANPAGATADAAPPYGGSPFVQQVRDRASDMVLAAMNFLGVPYRRGGTSAETGFDCSGFTRHIFEMSLGMVLPRRADEQANAPGLFEIAKAELKPGDLVFFNTLRRTFSHVGIYIGDGKFIHSPRAGHEVRVEDMRMAYWQQRFTGARRADTLATAASPAQPAASTGRAASQRFIEAAPLQP